MGTKEFVSSRTTIFLSVILLFYYYQLLIFIHNIYPLIYPKKEKGKEIGWKLLITDLGSTRLIKSQEMTEAYMNDIPQVHIQGDLACKFTSVIILPESEHRMLPEHASPL